MMRPTRLNTGEWTIVAEFQFDPSEVTTLGILSTIGEWLDARGAYLISIHNLDAERFEVVFTVDHGVVR